MRLLVYDVVRVIIQENMNTKETEQFRQQLLNLRSEVRALELELIEAGETVVLNQTSVSRLSRMDATQTQQMALEFARPCQVGSFI